MEFGVSTRLFYSEIIGVDTLERIRRAGFGRIEIFANLPHFNYHSRKLVQSVARWFQENALPPPSVHLPFEERLEGGAVRDLSVFAPDSAARQKALDEMKRCLELAERVRVAYVVLHPGVPGQRFTPACFDYAYAAVAQIQTFAGVRVLIENIENEISTFERLHEFVTLTKLDEVGVCYDTAHGHASGGVARFASAPAGMIKAMHLRDCVAGEPERRAWPFEGRIRWPRFIETVTLTRFDGPLIFETDDGDLGQAYEVSRRLDELRAEAENSIDEFRLKYKLPLPKRLEDEE
jgi:sugar phosphate isomerase/epimerase